MKSYKQIIDEEVELWLDRYNNSMDENKVLCSRESVTDLKNELKVRFEAALDEIRDSIGFGL